jgi:hypothetical protein
MLTASIDRAARARAEGRLGLMMPHALVAAHHFMTQRLSTLG